MPRLICLFSRRFSLLFTRWFCFIGVSRLFVTTFQIFNNLETLCIGLKTKLIFHNKNSKDDVINFIRLIMIEKWPQIIIALLEKVVLCCLYIFFSILSLSYVQDRTSTLLEWKSMFKSYSNRYFEMDFTKILVWIHLQKLHVYDSKNRWISTSLHFYFAFSKLI